MDELEFLTYFLLELLDLGALESHLNLNALPVGNQDRCHLLTQSLLFGTNLADVIVKNLSDLL